MTIEHVDITDPEIHEPKGASTAANKSVYYADGAGSGSWTLIKNILDLGWEYVQHDGAAQVFTTTAAKIGINGSGTGTDSTNLPPSILGSDNFWDTINNKIDAIALNDIYLIRLDLPISAISGAPTQIIIEFDVGGGVAPSNVVETIVLPVYKTAPFELTAVTPIQVTADMVTNGMQIFISVDAATNVSIDDPAIFIQRTYRSI